MTKLPVDNTEERKRHLFFSFLIALDVEDFSMDESVDKDDQQKAIKVSA